MSDTTTDGYGPGQSISASENSRDRPDVPHRHHDAIEFPDGSHVLVTLLCEGQRVTVLQLPVVQRARRAGAEDSREDFAGVAVPGWRSGFVAAGHDRRSLASRTSKSFRRPRTWSGARRGGVAWRGENDCGHQDHMAEGRTGDRAWPVYVQVRLADRISGRSRRLETISWWRWCRSACRICLPRRTIPLPPGSRCGAGASSRCCCWRRWSRAWRPRLTPPSTSIASRPMACSPIWRRCRWSRRW